MKRQLTIITLHFIKQVATRLVRDIDYPFHCFRETTFFRELYEKESSKETFIATAFPFFIKEHYFYI